MSDEDEIGEKSDMTRIEDLSEFLHQDDPDVDAAFTDTDEPPSTEDLPSLDDLDDEDDEVLFQSEPDQSQDEEDKAEFSASFDSEDDTESNYTFSNADNSEIEEEDPLDFDSTEEPSDFNSDEDENDNEGDFDSEDDSFDSSLNFDEEDDTNISFNNDDEETENDFGSSNDFESEIDFSDDDDDNEEQKEDFLTSDEDDTSFESDTEENSFEAPVQPVSLPQTATYVDRSEKFEDVKSFAKNITYGKIATGGNPPFSVILRNIKFEEDVEDIMIILNEHDLVTPDTEAAMKQSLEGGSLLISQISEYAAIYLTHKFRRFNLDIQMGLSDELHPSKSYESDSVGLISKSRVNQNKNETIRIDKSKVDLEGIIISTTPTLENYKIIEYLGIISDFVIVDEEELTNDQELSEGHHRIAKGHVDQDDEDSMQEIDIDIKVSQSAIYSDLSERLKPICLKKNANAVVGINYQITPISDGSKYKISCSGSAVWIIDNN